MAPRKKTAPPPQPTDPALLHDAPYIDEDAMNTIFGRATNTTIIREDENEFNIPEEIVDVLQTHGLLENQRTYQCVLKEMGDRDGANETMSTYIKSWRNGIPTIDWIAKNYGPGKYVLVLTWKIRVEETGNLKNSYEKIYLDISQKCMPMYRKFQLDKRIKDQQEAQEKIREAKIDNDIEKQLGFSVAESGNSSAPDREGAKAYLQEILSISESLGLTRKSGSDWTEIFKLIIPALPALITMVNARAQQQREQSERFMSLLLTATQSNSNTLVELVKNSQKPEGGSELIKQWGDMIMGAMDIKEALQGKKDSVVDRIADMIDRFSPLILAFAARPQAQLQADPQYIMAKSMMQANPDFQAVMSDPTKLTALVRRLDGFYGWEQTDQILSIGGIERPPTCPRDENLRHPQEETPEQGGAGVIDDTERNGTYDSENDG